MNYRRTKNFVKVFLFYFSPSYRRKNKKNSYYYEHDLYQSIIIGESNLNISKVYPRKVLFPSTNKKLINPESFKSRIIFKLNLLNLITFFSTEKSGNGLEESIQDTNP